MPCEGSATMTALDATRPCGHRAMWPPPSDRFLPEKIARSGAKVQKKKKLAPTQEAWPLNATLLAPTTAACPSQDSPSGPLRIIGGPNRGRSPAYVGSTGSAPLWLIPAAFMDSEGKVCVLERVPRISRKRATQDLISMAQEFSTWGCESDGFEVLLTSVGLEGLCGPRAPMGLGWRFMDVGVSPVSEAPGRACDRFRRAKHSNNAMTGVPLLSIRDARRSTFFNIATARNNG